ncbi:hypothetical protein HBB16_14240 [Pseudonocardia sp. MCCB 268]|nr:hypothetical protein [Pseudonocardia cytotoxica]
MRATGTLVGWSRRRVAVVAVGRLSRYWARPGSTACWSWPPPSLLALPAPWSWMVFAGLVTVVTQPYRCGSASHRCGRHDD